MSRPVILVADPLADAGLQVLRKGGEVVERIGLAPEEMRQAAANADAIVVRSSSQITADIMEAAPRLRVVARAGVGVDNIDVDAATRLGILVVNSPAGNTLAAAEHTIAMLLAAARNIPQAHAAMRSGRWDRGKFMGRQILGKTLGVVGFGRIGREVAARARGLGLRVLAYDPFISDDRVAAEGAQAVGLDQLLAESDFVTLHAQLTPETEGMIGEAELRRMKPSALLINCARGTLVQEKALVQALQEGWIDGAALDVFADDKHPSQELLEMPNVVVTPHLGASTEEAQVQVAVDVAEQVVAVLQGQPARSPVNAPALKPEEQEALAHYIELAEALGRLAAVLARRAPHRVTVAACDNVADEHMSLLARYLVAAYVRRATGQMANYVNAPLVAAERGIGLATARSQGPTGYERWLQVDLASDEGSTHLAGVLVGDGPPRIVDIDGFSIEVPPRGRTLMLWHGRPGQPGFIGKIGTILGDRGISIAGIEVGLEAVKGIGLMLVQVQQDLGDEVLAVINALPGVLRTAVVDFGGGS